MRKKTLVILSVLSIGLAIVGVVAFAVGGTLFASSVENCSSVRCATSAPDGLGWLGIVVGIVLFIVSAVLGIIAWVGGLVKQAQQQEWAWFICTLLFGNLCLWIYLIAVPERPQYAVPIYMPVYPPMQPYQGYPPQQPYEGYSGYQPQQQYYGEIPPNEPWRPS